MKQVTQVLDSRDWNKRVQPGHDHNGNMDLKLDKILRKLDKIMTTLDDVLAGVEAERTADASLIALVTGIRQQLIDILAGSLTPTQQAKVDAVFAKVNENVAAVNAAIEANQPPPPAP